MSLKLSRDCFNEVSLIGNLLPVDMVSSVSTVSYQREGDSRNIIPGNNCMVDGYHGIWATSPGINGLAG